MSIEVNGKTYDTDEEGYLTNLADWNEDVAGYIAKTENIDMTDQHWEVVNFLREYYNEFQIAPAVRVLTKAIDVKNFSPTYRALEGYDIEKLFVERESLEARGLAEENLVVPVEVLSREEMGKLMEEQDVVVSF